jgi:hypothetical protein
MAEDFWTPDNEDLVVPEQPAIAIYQNSWGQVVIRQEGDWNDDEDEYIRIGPQSLPAVIGRLQAFLREQPAPTPQKLLERPRANPHAQEHAPELAFA